ncbi:hypothetical protein [Paenibacillus amylolyticus]|uniref:hypothetical protein n=1 Tax=Paenibacillus amylolyticus TaxID=1451 RepID=UPI00096DFBBD|nr:hypothetical protein [Paenibacillus amylolyticus]OMF47731.1 hypothetical protein BK136_02230 [Paenibacillus amylolyticus]
MREIGCLVEAARWSHEGFAVISCTGEIYMPEDLGVKWVGGHYASMHTHGMTIDERRGPWTKGVRA